mgnify:CR=1 FL=1
MSNNTANWYSKEHDSAWENVKNAFKNDWEQTKNDFGADSARDLNQDVDDTVKQAAGADNAFENKEQAFRFGYAARQNFGSQHPQWNSELENQIRNDYEGNFDQDRDYIQYSYNYK